MVISCLARDGGMFLAAATVTEQSSLGSSVLTPSGEEARKGASNIGCL